MPLQTTVIGAWPKPQDLNIVNWFERGPPNHRPDLYNQAKVKAGPEEWQRRIDEGRVAVVKQQEDLDIDVITDGEVSRDTYIYHYCRQLQGIDTDNPSYSTYRGGALKAHLPVISGQVFARVVGGGEERESVSEWRKAQVLTARPVKYTLPGPLTIYGTCVDKHYGDAEKACTDLALCVRQEVTALVEAGCKYIQIDEPVFMREPERAKKFGVRLLGEIVRDLDAGVTTCVHLCCGYPTYLDQTDYQKADNRLYAELAPLLEASPINQVSIEDTRERMENLESVLSAFKTTQVVLGCVAVAKSSVEKVEDIRERLQTALRFISPDRLIVAPDCGLGFLPLALAQEKLANMVAAAKQL